MLTTRRTVAPIRFSLNMSAPPWALQARSDCRWIHRLWTTLAWPVDCQIHGRSVEISLGGVPMTRRDGTRMDGRDAFLKKLRRYPADRALMRIGEGRKARDFWDLVQYVLAHR